MLDIIGWAGALTVPFVGLPQLHKLITTRQFAAVSLYTYYTLVFAQVCLFVHAIDIGDTIFTLTSGIGAGINGSVLLILLWFRRHN